MKSKSIVLLFSFLVIIGNIYAQSSEECLYCHSDESLTMERGDKVVSIYVNQGKLQHSVHADLECVDCHQDFDPENIPHKEGKDIAKVDCSFCHSETEAKYDQSLHAEAAKEGKYLAPTCITCHGTHDILSKTNQKSKTFVMNVPNLCGTCHKEGTQVNKLLSISQHNVLENYSQSIHGDGLYKRGLIVTAVCTSCHHAHDILPPSNPKSSIARKNVPKTCMQCHAEIEQVHQKVIRGELWEKNPNQIPVCVDCHQPHKVRRVFYEDSFPDSMCMSCHKNKNLTKEVNGKKVSLYVDYDAFKKSVHKDNSCVKCHTQVSQRKNPVCLNSGKVDCSTCHSKQVSDFDKSKHAELLRKGDPDAPYCTDCHGEHNIMSKDNINSPIFSRNIPNLCGTCHRQGEKASRKGDIQDTLIVKHYTMSIHGKGLIQSGLMVTATCVDCHTSHRELPKDDPLSSVNPNNIAKTCSKCHLGIYEQFKSSIHSPTVAKTDKKLPVCNDCHLSHEIERVDKNDFRQEILDRCGKCHQEVTESYFDTFHGKVSKLGAAATAKCYDCHGSHNILPPSNPKSTLSRQNIVQTCKKCHENSNRKFVGYLTHATHHDKNKYPYLYYTFLFMSILLVSTFAFFGLHTLLWLPRSLKEKREQKKRMMNNSEDNDNE